MKKTRKKLEKNLKKNQKKIEKKLKKTTQKRIKNESKNESKNDSKTSPKTTQKRLKNDTKTIPKTCWLSYLTNLFPYSILAKFDINAATKKGLADAEDRKRLNSIQPFTLVNGALPKSFFFKLLVNFFYKFRKVFFRLPLPFAEE